MTYEISQLAALKAAGVIRERVEKDIDRIPLPELCELNEAYFHLCGLQMCLRLWVEQMSQELTLKRVNESLATEGDGIFARDLPKLRTRLREKIGHTPIYTITDGMIQNIARELNEEGAILLVSSYTAYVDK